MLIIKNGHFNSWKRSNTEVRAYTDRRKNSINLTLDKKKFCFSLHYNGGNSYLFVNVTEIYKFKTKASKILATVLCLGNI